MSAAPEICVNDRPRPLPPGGTVRALLDDIGVRDPQGVAVALNDAVVPRGEWPERRLSGGDRVLVIRAAQGG